MSKPGLNQKGLNLAAVASPVAAERMVTGSKKLIILEVVVVERLWSYQNINKLLKRKKG